MNRGFLMNFNKVDRRYYNIAQPLIDNQSKQIKEKISRFTDKNGVLRAEKITAKWFPDIKCDVFISHSRQDKKLALALGGYLFDQFGQIPFIDSVFWSHMESLQKLIDDEYCYNTKTETYSYERRNVSTSHVHMMITIALAKMIERTKFIIFLNTPNSIDPSEITPGTYSPWIYTELYLTKLLAKKESSMPKEENFSLRLKYDVDVTHLEKLSFENFTNFGQFL